MSDQRPNVLCVVTDQQRYDHLPATETWCCAPPNVDRIARAGVRLTRAYVNNSLCIPTRAAWFAGRPPRGHGVRTNGVPLDPTIPALTQALLDAGYRTHAVGKPHMRCFMKVRGLPVDALDPRVHVETQELRDSGRITKLPSPNHGLQTTDFVGWHGDWTFEEYVQLAAAHASGGREVPLDETPAGQTDGGRRLFVVFTPRGDKIRVISAREMTKRERAFYPV